MKVHYTKPIIRKILDAKFEAQSRDKEIEFIELTDSEWQRLKTEIPREAGVETEWSLRHRIFQVAGIRVCKEADFEGYGRGEF